MASIYGNAHLGGIRIGSQPSQAHVRPWTAMGVVGPQVFRTQPSSKIPAFAAEQHREASG